MIKGMPTTFGSLSMKDNIAEVTSPLNERIIKAGGIVHARTATPEFSRTVTTHTKLWAVTRNPWNLSLTPADHLAARRPRSPPAHPRFAPGLILVGRSASRHRPAAC